MEPIQQWLLVKSAHKRLINDHESFMQSYRAFQLSESDIAEVKAWPSDLHVDVYFGTWCHDSQREVPQIFENCC